MRGRLDALTSRTRRVTVGICALTVGLMLAALGQIWLTGDPGTEGWGGPRWLSTVIATAAIAPVLLVRRRPLGPLAVSVGAGYLNIALTAPHQGAVQPFLAAVVLTFAVGANLDRRGSAVALAVLLSCTIGVGVLVRVAQDYPSGEFLPVVVWFVAAWSVGRLVRSWRVRAEELDRLTRLLAAERDARAREAVNVERARIARELHDVIAHNISVMGVQAAAADRVLDGEQPVVRGALGIIQITARATVEEMRRMLGVLRTTDDRGELAPLPGLDDLGELVDRARAAGLPVEIHVEGTPPALPAGLELSAYRIVQEALTNVVKHAGDARAAVTVRYTPDALELEVVDDGPGDGQGGGTGHGLLGMRERVALFGGEVVLGPRDDGGWMLRARLPIGAA